MKNSEDENQVEMTFENVKEWQNKMTVVNADDFVGYEKTVDQKRIVVFDFINSNAYVASEDLIDEFNLDNKTVKEAFPGLVVLKQNAKNDGILDTDDNLKTHEQAQKAYVVKELDRNKDKIAERQKADDEEAKRITRRMKM